MVVKAHKSSLFRYLHTGEGFFLCIKHSVLIDPACGSGSLLIRAADEAPFDVSIYGQEKDNTTAGLAKMNLVLHNKATGEIYAGNTFSDPHYTEEKDDSVLKRFDFAVANPPFSLKNWTDGVKDYGRFSGYGAEPPEKNGDFAWLMHILKSLKRTGKAAVILPHGVLFRGNAEAIIRKTIIDKGYIKGIIGLAVYINFSRFLCCYTNEICNYMQKSFVKG